MLAAPLNAREILIMGGVDDSDKNDIFVYDAQNVSCRKVAADGAPFHFFSENNSCVQCGKNKVVALVGAKGVGVRMIQYIKGASQISII